MSKGKILLVGFGPGSGEHMTFRAREAIEESDVVIGYSTYINLVKDLLRDKEVIRKGMTEETDRAVEAYEHAKKGKTVALISSGDIGVYGMAGPSYEVLFQAGWKPGDDIEVELVPGTTALSSCAARVGSPLTHDFCSISLSDLLTPWPTIARRLDAVADSDFVIALYNPKSGRRRQQIVEAQRIFLKYRSPDTPVAIVKSAYRDLEKIQLVTLKEMADCDIGMLTTVLIGNSSTFFKEGLMVTPRGYANKYENITGSVKAGEKRGRSLSLGLDGWKASIKEALSTAAEATDATNIEAILEAKAADFELSIEEIFLALASSEESSQDDIVLAHQLEREEGLKAFTRFIKESPNQDSPMNLTIGEKRTGQTQLSAFDANNVCFSDNNIVLDNKEGITANIHTAAIQHIWTIEKDGITHSIWLLDKKGNSLLYTYIRRDS